MTDPDDDALRWEGDEEYGRATSLDRPASRDRDDTAADAAAAASVRRASGYPDEVAPRDRVLTVATAAFALLFLAEAVGWILVTSRVGTTVGTASGWLGFLDGILRFLGLLAAPVWFAVVLRVAPRRRVVRIGWFALGVGLLLPWPLLLGLIL